MTITTQAVRELVDKLIPTGLVEYRTGELSRLPAECIAMLLALVEERDRLAAAVEELTTENKAVSEQAYSFATENEALTARAEAAEAALREMRSEEMIERVARAWATMDGKADLFDREKGLPISEHIDDPTFTGAYEGYMEDARELMRRSELIKRATFQGRDGDG